MNNKKQILDLIIAATVNDVEYRERLINFVYLADEIICIDNGEEFIIHATGSGLTHSLSILNSGLTWIVGSNEASTCSTVSPDYIGVFWIPNGKDTCAVIVTGMSDFIVIDRTGFYYHNTFVSNVTSGNIVNEETEGLTEYRYWSRPDSLSLSISNEIKRLKEIAILKYALEMDEIPELDFANKTGEDYFNDPEFLVGKFQDRAAALVVRLGDKVGAYLNIDGIIYHDNKVAMADNPFSDVVDVLVNLYPKIANYKALLDSTYR